MKIVSMLDQIHPNTHPYILDVIDVKVVGHCNYQSITALLGMEKIHGRWSK